MVRGSILAALDAIDAADASDAAGGRDRSPARIARLALDSPRAGLGASCDRCGRRLRFRDAAWRRARPRRTRSLPFDIAIDHYAQFVEHFEPNVKSDSPADISDAYMDHQLPGFLWNFQQSGYKLIGGRLDRLPDGSPVAYTFYRGDTGTILCTYMKSHGLQPPDGEIQEDRTAITTTSTRATASA